MSGTQVSSFGDPNLLLQTLSGAQTANVQRNQLLNQQTQQTLGENEAEMMARASQGLLNLKTEEERAAAYPGTVAQLQQLNFAKNAPSTYPGEATLRRIALLGTPSSTQAEWQSNIAANQAIAGAGRTGTGTGTTATTPATGTGTVTAQPVEPDALTRAQAVRDGLIKRGLDPDTATAFASNALHESAARPDTGAGDAGASHGVFQWQGPRYEGYKSVFGNAPDNAPLDQQLDYVMHELNTTETAAREQIAAAKTPEEKAAAISKYYLRPRDVEGEQTRRSATARQLVSQWAGAGQPATTYLGDSLVEPGGVGGQTGRGVRGASPDAVLARLRDTNATSDTQIRGRNIVLSSGASNDPEHAQLLASQLQTLKDRGAGAVTVLGVGPGVKNAAQVNAQLQQIAERNGARFVALPADQMGKDGVHPTKEGYAALQAQVQAAPAPAAPGGGQPPRPYQVAGAVVPPPTGVPGATANVLAPGAPGAPAAATVQPAPQNAVAPTPAQPPAAAPPQPPRLTLNDNGLTTQQQATVDALGGTGKFTGQQRVALEEQYRQHNATQQTAAQQLAETQRQHQIENERQAAAAVLAQKTQGVPTGYQRNASGAIEPIPGYEDQIRAQNEQRSQTAQIQQQQEVRAQAEFDQKMVEANRPYPGSSPEAADMNILVAGSQPGGDPSSVEYRNAFARQKYKESSAGTTIARDMSMFKPPVAAGGAAADTAPTVTASPTQIFERENKLRDEFQRLTADFRVVQNSYENLYESSKKPTGAGDMSLLYSYVRLLDPTSVVRESEFAQAAASGSFGERVQGAVGRVLSGERLPDSLRNDFVREAGNLYKTQLRNHNQMADTYTRLAQDSGVDPKKVVTRFDRPQAADKPVGTMTVVVP